MTKILGWMLRVSGASTDAATNSPVTLGKFVSLLQFPLGLSFPKYKQGSSTVLVVFNFFKKNSVADPSFYKQISHKG